MASFYSEVFGESSKVSNKEDECMLDRRKRSKREGNKKKQFLHSYYLDQVDVEVDKTWQSSACFIGFRIDT